jgi:DNA-binding NarL/FixJ family response regulator
LLLTCDGFVHDAANAAFDLGGVCLVSPAGAERVAQFLSAGRPLSTCVPRTARAWRARYQLSAGETDVLIRSALGECRVAIASNSGSAVATVKKQISNLLRKTSEESLHATAERLFRDAMCM